MSTNASNAANANANPDPQQPKKKKSKPSALADTLRDWESLLAAIADHVAELPPIEPYRMALADSMEKVKRAKDLQESQAASKQAATQALTAVVVEGKDQAIRLRGAIRAALGPTTELLKQYGIRPLRRRPLRHKGDPSTPPPAPQPEVITKEGNRGAAE